MEPDRYFLNSFSAYSWASGVMFGRSASVVDWLILPLALARRRVQGQDGVSERITSLSEASIEVVCGRSRCGENPAALLIDGNAAPGVGAAESLSLWPVPRVLTELTRLRDG